MKLKSIYKYLICQQGKSYLIYFGIIFVIVHLGLFLTVSLDSSGGIGGMEMTTLIFMLVSGIVIYKESLSVSLQNGISRRTFFIASMLIFITISLIAACGDILINVLGNTYEKNYNMMYDSMYEQMFMREFNDEWIINIPVLSDYPKMFMLNFAMYITMSVFGFLINAVLYRLIKALKIIIPIGIYIILQTLTIIVPVIDYKFFDSKVINAFTDFMGWLHESVSHVSVVLLCLAVIFSAVTFLFIRRVPLNDNKK